MSGERRGERPDARPSRQAPPAEPPEEELVPADDQVIGTVFRRSLVVVAAVAALALLVALLFRGEEAPETAVEAEIVAPRQVRAAAEPPAVRFTDVTGAAGIDYRHFTGATGDKLLPETMGGGGGFFDYDADGRPDIVLIGGTSWPGAEPRDHPPSVVIYRNLGDGRFEDRTAALGLAGTDFYGMGLAAADYDGDGRTDLFVTALGANRLFRNTPGGFVDVGAKAGVAGGSDTWSTGAAFFDYDLDGDLDLFVCNYVQWSREIDFELDYRLTGVGRAYGPPLNYQGSDPYLYRNDGDGTFTEVSATAGVRVPNPATGGPIAKSLAVVVLDPDHDGWPDLMVANDTVQNFFFHNRGDGTFEEAGEVVGLAYDRNGSATGAMGVDAGYYRNGDEIGLAIGNFANEMTSLYVSQGDPRLFADEAIPEGIGATTREALSFGVLFLDYDLDGWLDLLMTNGHLEEEIAVVDPSQSYEQRPQLFWNSAGGSPQSFVPVAIEGAGAAASPIVGRGSAYADIDADGDLDLLLLQTGGRPLLLRNDQRLGHHWLRVRLAGRGMNREALGARVELVAGGVTQRRFLSPYRGYLSQVELPMTFGLGDASTVESLVVHWPDGTVVSVPEVEVDRLRTVER